MLQLFFIIGCPAELPKMKVSGKAPTSVLHQRLACKCYVSVYIFNLLLVTKLVLDMKNVIQAYFASEDTFTNHCNSNEIN